ncbi:tenascin-X-like [Anneissia japonica]|uniref:tenascin-X-like n=1 Tax=Anneissia japonica TaxID=1529436 RepID=UPI001425BA22|nr:tenascin-X-like [Anneissia japonica]
MAEDSTTSSKKTFTPEENKYYVFLGLSPGTEYTISLRILGTGEPNKSAVVTTKPPAPQFVQTTNSNFKSLVVSWTAPLDTTNLDYYSVSYRPNLGIPRSPIRIDVSGNRVRRNADDTVTLQIDDLPENTVFDIIVSSVAGNSAQDISITGVTDYLDPGEIYITNVTYKSFEVFYGETTDPSFVEYTFNIMGGNQMLMLTRSAFDVRSFLVENLEYSTLYCVELDDGVNPPTKKNVTTEIYFVGEVNVTFVDEETIEFIWDDPTLPNFFVSFTIEPNEGTATIDETSNSGSVSGLTPGKLYSLSIFNNTETERRWSVVDVRTYPVKPRGFDGITPLYTSISLSWYFQTDVVYDSFRVIYEPANGIDPVPIDVTDTQITLEGLAPNTEYKIEVRTVSGDGDNERISQRSSIAYVSTVPVAMGVVLVRSYSNDSILITWGEISGENSYILEISPVSSNDSKSIEHTGDRQFEFTGLTPGQLYNITVRGNNSFEEGFVLQRTNPNPVASLEITNTSLTTLTLIWSEPEVEGGLEVIFGGYVLTYKENGGLEVNLGFLERGTIFYTITNLDPATTYTVCIRTRMGSGDTQVHSSVVTDTEITDAIANDEIFVRNFTEKTIEILWAENPFALRYTVYVWPTSRSRGEGMSQDTGNTTSALTGLVPGELYTIQVEIDLGNGNDSVLQTQWRTYPVKPIGFDGITPLYTNITLSWYLQADVVYDSFRVTYEPANGIDPVPIDVTDTQITLEGLIPGTEYTIEVRTVSGDGDNERISQTSSKTYVSTVPVGMGVILVHSYSNDSISITWGEISGENSYILEITPVPSNDSKSIEHTGDRQFEFTGLTPGQLLNITVRGNNSFEEGFVLQRTNPNPVTFIEITNTSLTTLTLIWSEPEVEGGLEVIFGGYVLTYKENGGSEVNLGFLERGTNFYTITNLYPTTTYTVCIRTRMGSGDTQEHSSVVTDTEITDAIANNTIFVRNFTERTIEILWPENPFALRYTVYVWPTSRSRGEGMSQDTGNTTSALRELTYLVPGELYTIQVEIDLGNGNDSVLQTQWRTYPVKPDGFDGITPLYTNITLSWYFQADVVYDSFRVTYEPASGIDPVPIDVTDTQITLEGLIPGTEYTIEVRTVSGDGDNERISQTSSKTYVSTVPVGMGVVLVHFYSNDSISITWGEISGENSYILEITPVSSNDSKSIEHTGDRQFEFTGLTPGQLFNITVRGNNSFEEGIVLQRTNPNPVAFIEITNTSLTTLTLIWSEPEVEGGLEVIFGGYVLTYKENGGSEVNLGFLERGTNFYTITNLYPTTTYTVCIRTRMGSGDTQEHSSVVTHTEITDAIANGTIFVRSFTERSIEILWPENPFALKYTVYVWPTSGSRGEGMSQDTGNTTSALRELTDLVPGELYTIQVEIDLGNGNDSVLQTQWRTYPEKPRRFDGLSPSYTSIALSWNLETDVVYDFFRVTYEPDNGLYPVPIDVTDTQITLEGLTPDTDYKIEVRTVSGDGDNERISQGSSNLYARTVPVGMGVVFLTSYSNVSISITWDEINGENSYILQITPEYGSGGETIEYSGDRQFEFTELIPGQLYNITLRGNNSFEEGYLLQRTKPNSPAYIEFDDSLDSYTSLFVEWDSPVPVNDIMTIFSGYIVRYRADSGTVVDVRLNSTETNYTIMGLSHSREYEVLLLTESEDVLSDEISAVGDTAYLSADEIVVLWYNTKNITAIWGGNASQDGFENYTVSLEPADGGPYIINSALQIAHFYNLIPGRLYTIRVETVVNGTALTTTKNQRTVPSMVSVNASVVMVDSTLINLQWTPPEGDFSGFEVTHSPADGPTTSIILLPANEFFHNFMFLLPTINYTFEIVTISSVRGYEERSPPLQVTFVTGDVTAAEIIVRDINSTFVRFTWGSASGTFNMYRITIDPVPNNGSASSLDVPVTDQKLAEFVNLTPGQMYYITIEAVGTNISLANPVRTYPEPVGSFETEHTLANYTSVTVTFSPPELVDGIATVFDFYEIVYHTATSVPVTMMLNKDSTSFTATDLDPDKTYYFSIIVVSGDLKSGRERTIANTTSPGPGILFVRSVVGTSIDISWGGAEDDPDFEGYSITIVPADGMMDVDLLERRAMFTDLTPGEEYTISLEVTNVNPQPDTYTTRLKPAPPTSLDVSSKTDTSFTVTWERPVGVFAEYRLEIYGYENAVIEDTTLSSAFNIYIKSSLIPGRNYTVRLTAKSGNLYSETATVVATLVSLEPLQFDLLSRSSTSLTYNFGFVEGATDYHVSTDDDDIVPITVPVGMETFTLNDLTPGRLYVITIKARMVATVLRMNSTEVRTTPLPVESVTVMNTGLSTKVDASWVPASASDYTSFAVSYTDVANVRTDLGITTELEMTITELEQDSTYTLFITVVSGEETDTEIRSSAFSKPFSTMVLDPGQIEIQSFSTISLTVVWGATDNNAATSYDVAALLDGVIAKQMTVGIGEETKGTLEGLATGVCYAVRLTIGGISSVTEIEACTQPNPATNFEVSIITSTTMDLQWTPPVGSFDNYQITYKVTGETETQEMLVNFGLTTATLTALTPETMYDISIVSQVHFVGGSVDSDSATIQKSTVTSLIRVDSVTTTSLTYSYEPSEQNTNDYQLVYTPNEGLRESPVSYAGPVTAGQETLTQLTPGTLYSFSWQTVNSGVFQQEDAVAAYTKPEPVTALQITSTTSSSLTVDWTAPTIGNFDGYKLAYFALEQANDADLLGQTPSPTYFEKNVQLPIVLNGLAPNVKYFVQINTYVGSNSLRVLSDQEDLFMNTATSDVFEAYVISVTTSSIEVQWSNASSGYTVAITKVSDSTTMSVSVADDLLSYLASSLDSGEVYTISVTADLSSMTSTIQQATKPQQATGVSSSSTTSSITVNWQAGAGSVDGFIVTYSPDTGNPVPPITVILTATLEVTISGLDADTSYDVTIQSYVGTEGSRVFGDAVSENVLTELPEGAMISVISTTSSTINVAYTESFESDVTSFTVTITSENNVVTTDSVPKSQLTYQFEGLQPATFYTISVSTNGANVESGMATTITNPSNLANLTVTDKSQSQIMLSWISPTGDFDGYNVEYTTASGPAVNKELPSSDTSLSLQDLLSNTEYTFTLTAYIEKSGFSKESEVSTISVTTDALVLTINELSTTSLRITWTAIPDTQYELIIDPPVGSLNSVLLNEGTFDLSELTVGITYQFILNIVVADDQSRLLVGKTTYTLPPEPPSQPVVNDITSTSAIVWITPPIIGSLGSLSILISETALGAGAGTPIDETIVVANDGCPTLQLTGLKPGTMYTITVNSVSGNAMSTPVQSTFTTGPAVEGTISIGEVTATSIVVFWEKLSSKTSGSYQLVLELNNIEVQRMSFAYDSVAEYTFVDLIDGTQYEIIFLDEDSGTSLDTTFQNTRPNEPGDVTLAMETGCADIDLTINWSPASGNFDGYQICYRPVDGPQSPITVSSASSSYTFVNLNPDTEYTISVAAYTGTDSRVLSTKKTLIIRTKLDCSISDPGVLTAVAVNDASIRVEWESPSGDNYDGFLITYTPDNGQLSSTVFVLRDLRTILLSGLISSEEYTISLVTVREGATTEKSNELTVKETTDATAFGLKLVSATDSSLTFTWSRDNTPATIDDYTITYTPADGDSSFESNVQTFGITGLQDDTQYSVTLRAKYNGNIVFSSDITVKTLLSAPPTPEYSAIDYGYGLLQLKNPTYLYDHFEVAIYTIVDNSRSTSPISEMNLPRNACPKLNLNLLQPFLSYVADVVAVLGNGDKSTPRSFSFSTNSPGSLDISTTSVTLDSIEFTWTPASGDFTNYLVRYNPADGTTPEVTLKAKNDRRMVLQGLAGGTYTIQVETQGNDMQVSNEYMRRTELPAVMDVQAVATENRTLNVDWTIDESGHYFQICYQTLGYDSQVVYTIVGESTTLLNLNSDAEYLISVSTASTLAFSDPQSVMAETQESFPCDIKSQTFTTDSVTITWAADPDLASDYEVMRTDRDGTSNAFTDTVSKSGNAAETYTFSDLTPGQEYLLKLTCGTKTRYTRARTIPLPPTDFRVVNTEQTAVDLAWVTPSNNVFTYYQISYTPTGGNPESPINAGAAVTQRIDSLAKATRYTFKIVAYAGEGSLQRVSDAVEVSTVTPIQMYVVSWDTRTISVNWDTVNDMFDNYEVSYSPYVDNVGALPSPRPVGTSTSLEIYGLSPGEEYTITLKTFKDLMEITELTTTVVQQTKPASVPSMDINQVTTTMAVVTWDRADGIVDDYEFSYSSWNTTAITSTVAFDSERSMTLNNLVPATVYTVTLVTMSGNQFSDVLSKDFSTTPLPPNITSVIATENSLTIEWALVSSVSELQLDISPPGGNLPVVVLQSSTSYQINSLDSGKTYTVYIQSRISNSVGTIYSETVSVVEQTNPTAPYDIMVQDQDFYSLQFMWLTDPQDVADNYRVTLVRNNDGFTIEETISGRTRFYNGLPSATAYTFSVFTNSGAKESEARSITTHTSVIPPVITIGNVSTSSIDYSWVVPVTPQYDGAMFSVRVTGPSGETLKNTVLSQKFYSQGMLTPYTLYNFYISTTVGNLNSGIASRVVTTAPAVPDGVIDLIMAAKTSNQVTLQWAYNGNIYGAFENITVKYIGYQQSVDNVQDSGEIAITSRLTSYSVNITSLTPGLTYTFDVSVHNHMFSSDAAMVTVQLVQSAPPKPSVVLSSTPNLDRSSTSITIQMRSDLFSTENGPISHIVIIVAQDGAQVAVATQPLTYFQVENLDPRPPYQTSGDLNVQLQSIGRRKRREVSTNTFVVGSEDCNAPNVPTYCNGELEPRTAYRFLARAYGNDGSYTDSDWSEPITTNSDVLWFVWCAIAVGVLLIFVLVIMCAMISGKCCNSTPLEEKLEDEARRNMVFTPIETVRMVRTQSAAVPVTNAAAVQSSQSHPLWTRSSR